jgi:carbamoyl-phosphate synthase large subunit
MAGRRLSELGLTAERIPPYFSVKEAVFPFGKFPDADPILGPEMRSTGEVLGMARSFGLAFFKAEEAAGPPLPTEGTVLITVSETDRPAVLEVARQFEQLGFRIKATRGTHQFLTGSGVQAEVINKLYEGRPSILDGIKNKQIDLIINTPAGKLAVTNDAYIRKEAIRQRIPCLHTVAAARAAAEGIAARRKGQAGVKSLQAYHAEIG